MDQFEKIEEIDLKELWFIFRKNIKIIAAITLVAVVLTSLVSIFLLDKEYESYTTLMLGKPNDYNQESNSAEITYNDVLLNQKLVSTYSEIVKSKVVTNEVIEQLNLKMTSGSLGSIVSVSTLNQTEIIMITVRYTDPIIAAEISNKTAEVFTNYVSDLMKIDNINIIDVAEVYEAQVAPNTSLNIMISLVLGLMVGVFVVFIREYLNTKIRDPKEIEKLSSHPVLAVIPHSKLLE